MRWLVIAAGNSLRRDDGVAHRVLELLTPGLAETCSVLEFTPELAPQIAAFDAVLFIDADAAATALSIEALEPLTGVAALTHVAGPGTILALSQTLYAFSGKAFLCRIPVNDFSPGEGLDPGMNTCARAAAQAVQALLGN